MQEVSTASRLFRLNRLLKVALPGFLMAASALCQASEDALDVFELIESDPSLREQFALDEALSEAWLDAMTCHLLVSEQPRVRLYASLSLNVHKISLTCAELGGPVDPRQVRQGIFQESKDAAMLHAIYLADCNPANARLMNAVIEANDMASEIELDARPGPSYCASTAIPDTLMTLDPSNASVRLMPVLAIEEPLTPETYALYREVVMEASKAERFDLYYMRGSLEVYDAIAAYMNEYPAPGLSRGVNDVLAPLGLTELAGSPWWMGSNVLFSASLMNHFTTPSILSQFCSLAKSREDAPALEACLTLADMLEDEQTFMGQHFGQAQRWRLESPPNPDPEAQAYTHQWKNHLRGLVMECERPRLLFELEGWDEQREREIRRYVADLSSTGERFAVVQAAAREQQQDLVKRQVDPTRCGELWSLDEATQRDLLELMGQETPEAGRYAEALKGLAEALTEPGGPGAGQEVASP